MKLKRLTFTCVVLCATVDALAVDVQAIVRLPSAAFVKDFAAKAPSIPTSSPIQLRDLNELVTMPAAASGAPLKTKVQNLLKQNEAQLGLTGDSTTLVPTSVTETLTGKHVVLEQQLNGLKVLEGNVLVNFDEEEQLLSIIREVVKVPVNKSATITKNPTLTEDQARDIVWNDLHVTGKFMEPPTSELAYLNERNVLTLVYVVSIAVSQPFGYWEYRVDAITGRIISHRDRRIQERKMGNKDQSSLGKVDGPTVSLQAALVELQRSVASSKANANAGTVTTASALVFSPNPVTTLGLLDLASSDPPARFELAYVEVMLDGVRNVNGVMYLASDLVRIEDFEPGVGGAQSPPSTTTSAWTARRGNNAFNDVMVYFYIQSSLTYLRKLGYSGSLELFPNGIAADSDGLAGDDNSHYVPDSDRLAFGHGCVPDTEDSDVILHELGHAVQWHVNKNWSGGDSGAIGEGFGDYWAVSQRLRIKNGWAVQPGKVFVWDGIDFCWGGRRADRKGIQYDPRHTYQAHEPLQGFVSDELWSSPLVASLLELQAAGETFESIDTIVLEGMASIGRNFTMRTLAQKTVEVARHRHPTGPHGDVFEKNFRALGILQ